VWSLALNSALPNGAYTIVAQAFDADGPTTSQATTILDRLVVDTVGPRITSLVFDNRRGRVVAAFQDYGGKDDAGVGLDIATVVDANNDLLALIGPAVKGYRASARRIVGGIAVDPGGSVGPQVATITINDGSGIRGGRYLFTVKSVDPSNPTGVQDLAGNALDGEFYGTFSSGNRHVGGDFVAAIDAVHRRVLAPRTVIGTASPVHPPGVRRPGRADSRPARPLPTGPLSVANPLHARRLAVLNLSRPR
jgi:hypothetical protein